MFNQFSWITIIPNIPGWLITSNKLKSHFCWNSAYYVGYIGIGSDSRVIRFTIPLNCYVLMHTCRYGLKMDQYFPLSQKGYNHKWNSNFPPPWRFMTTTGSPTDKDLNFVTTLPPPCNGSTTPFSPTTRVTIGMAIYPSPCSFAVESQTHYQVALR